MSTSKSNPFNWDIREDSGFMSVADQRTTDYVDVADEVFTGNEGLSFYYNGQAPTPQLRAICGISAPEDSSSEGGSEGGNEGGNEGGTTTEPTTDPTTTDPTTEPTTDPEPTTEP